MHEQYTTVPARTTSLCTASRECICILVQTTYVIHSATGFNLQPGFYSILSLARGLCVKIAIQAFGYFTLFFTTPRGISKSMRAVGCLYYYVRKQTNKYQSRSELFLILANPPLIHFYKSKKQRVSKLLYIFSNKMKQMRVLYENILVV